MIFLAKTFLFGRELTLWEAGAGIWQGLRAISPIVSISPQHGTLKSGTQKKWLSQVFFWRRGGACNIEALPEAPPYLSTPEDFANEEMARLRWGWGRDWNTGESTHWVLPYQNETVRLQLLRNTLLRYFLGHSRCYSRTATQQSRIVEGCFHS
jgi:hypothetical protein